MKNQKFTILASELNTNTVQEINTYLDLLVSSPAGGTETRRAYPNKVQYINKSGIDLQTNIFSSAAEYADYQADDSNYNMFTILNNTSVVLTSQSLLPTAYKILVLAPSGSTASGTLVIDCIGYQPKGF
jgi:hypothetical protein